MKQMSLQFTAPERSEGNLQSSKGQQVGNDSAGEDAIESRVREAGPLGYRAYAPMLVDDATQGDSEQPEPLVARVVEGSVRPTGREVTGLRSDLPHHGTSVRETTLPARVSGVGYTYSHDDFVDAYSPRIPAARWAPIAPFVREHVRRVGRMNQTSAMKLLRATANYAEWAVENGFELDASVLLGNDMITHYVDTRRRETGTDQLQLTSLLQRLAAAEDAGFKSIPTPTVVNANEPYTPVEMTKIYSWATGQNKVSRRINGLAVLTLAAGAGLKRDEITDLWVGDVAIDSTPVVITCGDKRRTTVVTAEWEKDVRKVVEGRSAGERIFIGDRDGGGRSLVYSFIKNSQVDTVRPHPERLRATWIVNHLRAGTPVDVLAAAAGTTARALDRYAPFVKRTRAEAIEILRLGGVR